METILNLIQFNVGAAVMGLTGLVALNMLLIVFPVLGFRKAWWWGVTCLVFPGIGTLVFSFSHFRETWKYLAVTVVFSAVSVGIFLVRSFLIIFFTQPIA